MRIALVNLNLRRQLLALLFTAAFVPGLIQGQTVAPSTAVAAIKPVPEDEEVLVLSPFTVSAAKDNGYQATTTLAGTRLRSELKDVGTSISIINSEFLRDTGATDTGSLLTYVTGSEVAGLSGNLFGGSQGDAISPPSEVNSLRAPNAVTRLRALASASETRDFYSTNIPLDAYNIERIEVNRGANSILFGMGSPAGIINSSLKQAKMKNTYTVEMRYGSYESSRGSFDLNQQLIKGELAIRLNGLEKRQKYRQDFAFVDDERLYGALTYDPKWARTKNGVLSGTVLRANFETGNLDSERPRVLPPSNRITNWFEPFNNAYPAKVTFDAANARVGQLTAIAMQTTNFIFRNASVWFDNPDSGTPGTGSMVNGVSIVGRQGIISNMPAGIYPAGTGLFASAADVSFIAAALKPTALADRGSYIRPTLTDPSVFDFRSKLLEGPNRFEYANFDTNNVVLEQHFFKNRAGIELAMEKEKFVQGTSALQESSRQTELSIDINTTLIDGSVNPNFGRPFITGAWFNTYARADYSTKRATAYYKFDFADVISNRRWANALGKLSFTGLYEKGKVRAKGLSGDRYGSGTDYIYGPNQLITDPNGGRLTQLSYVGPSLASATTAHGANIPGLTALQLPIAANGQTFLFRKQVAGSPFVATPMTIIDDGLIPEQLATDASMTGRDTLAQAAVAQGKMLWNSLVLTMGWRRDSVDNFTARTPGRGVRNNLIVDESVWMLPTTPTVSNVGNTESRSVVFHVPTKFARRVPLVSGLSLRYNTSDNFSPGGSRFDSTGAVLTPPSGTTRDVGFSLGLADDRIIVTATWYTTKQKNITAGGTNLNRNVIELWRLVRNLEGLGRNPNLSQIQAPPQSLLDLYSFQVNNGTGAYVNRSDVVSTTDAVSKGAEFEAYVNLTRNWRLTANATRQSAVRSNTAAAFRKIFFEDKTGGKTLYESWSSPEANMTYTTEAGSTLAEEALTRIINPYNAIALQDGGPAQELRKWHFNVVTTYSFDHNSRLKGFSIGSGGRWQDKVAIGFPFMDGPGGVRIPDVKHPFYGPTEFNMDSWLRYERRIFRKKINATVQLNVFNLLNNDELIPIGTQPDGSIASYRIPAERRYEFTVRFDY